ncbi:unnamed protein product [Closterium sp. NIES-65]|nr:unnamed protein product [Closterium sp. NIES-65]
MAVDRTEDYRDTVKSLAVRLGYDQARLAQVSSAMMLKPTSGGGEASTKDAFARLACDVVCAPWLKGEKKKRELSDERALHSALMSEGREYCSAASDHVVGHGVMERRRDAFEAKVGGMVKECKEGIEALRCRLPPPGGAMGRNAQLTAHQHGVSTQKHLHLLSSSFEHLRAARQAPQGGTHSSTVRLSSYYAAFLSVPVHPLRASHPPCSQVLILTEHLQLLSSTFERLRSTRLQRMLADSQRQRQGGGQGGGQGTLGKQGRIQALKGVRENERDGGEQGGGKGWQEEGGEQQGRGGEHDRGREQGGQEQERRGQEQMMQDAETVALQEELRGLLSSTAQTEARVMELAALNHLFAVHVLQQSEQVHQLYAEAVAASERIDKGNKELKKAASHGSSQRTFLILFFFVLPLSLLFYDWYDRRQRIGFGLW